MKRAIWPWFLSGCLLLASSGLWAGESPREAELIFKKGDPRIGTYISNPRGFETSSYWIEGPTGLIWIDTQFLISAGEEALNWAEKATGKKVLLAIVLHPNPDKFNGTANFQKRGIRVVTSDQVLALITGVHKDRHHWFYERYKPDYPNEAAAPESFGKVTTELTAGGITVKAHVVGAGCSATHVIVEYDGHLFPGDLVTSLNHSWLELGLVDEWLTRIDEMKNLKPRFVHPGRGPSGDEDLLVREESYLKKVKELVLAQRPKLPVDEQRAELVVKKLDALYPGYGNKHFIEIGIPAVWATLAAKNALKNKK